ncbi:MAG TPA: GNAT family N-acetyltransferase, partial [Flavobacteriales bacterium]|nr:GNAT family N-acetyltransferase [Flavobacteriales bacterium]
REQFPALERSRVLKPADERSVWSVSCFFVRKDVRRQGLTVQLLKAAAEAVRERGGERLEGYPVLPYTEKMPAAFAWTGLHQAFLDAGFTEAARHSAARPIMRLEL